MAAALLLAAAIAVASGLALLWRGMGAEALDDEIERVFVLRDLPPNRWVRYHEERPDGWSRQGHAGIAFDSKRGSLLVYGSDTHGQDWDNTVHEFHPLRKRWQTHQATAGPETYRVDATGAPVAGSEAGPRPWAMHTYDAIEYHAGLDALVVMSTTEHNPRAATVPGLSRQPTWIYDLTTRRWRTLDHGGAPAPTFFGGSAAYDERRGVLVAYRHGLWELDAAAVSWRKVPTDVRLGLHHTMVYDTRRGQIAIFGDYRATSEFWVYDPGPEAGAPGRTTRVRPRGDTCPALSAAPVAYDAAQDLFVLVADGRRVDADAGAASTYIYDPASQTCTKLAGAGLPPVGMNFMMTWDRNHEVVFLVTGDGRGTVTVWALKPRR